MADNNNTNYGQPVGGDTTVSSWLTTVESILLLTAFCSWIALIVFTADAAKSAKLDPKLNAMYIAGIVLTVAYVLIPGPIVGMSYGNRESDSATALVYGSASTAFLFAVGMIVLLGFMTPYRRSGYAPNPSV